MRRSHGSPQPAPAPAPSAAGHQLVLQRGKLRPERATPFLWSQRGPSGPAPSCPFLAVPWTPCSASSPQSVARGLKVGRCPSGLQRPPPEEDRRASEQPPAPRTRGGGRRLRPAHPQAGPSAAQGWRPLPAGCWEPVNTGLKTGSNPPAVEGLGKPQAQSWMRVSSGRIRFPAASPRSQQASLQRPGFRAVINHR